MSSPSFPSFGQAGLSSPSSLGTVQHPVSDLLQESSPESDNAQPVTGSNDAVDNVLTTSVPFSTDSVAGPTRLIEFKLHSRQSLRSRNIDVLFDWVKNTVFQEAEDIFQVGDDTIIAAFDSLTQAERAINITSPQDQAHLQIEGNMRFINFERFLAVGGGPVAFNPFGNQMVVAFTRGFDYPTPDLTSFWVALLTWCDQWLGHSQLRAVGPMESVTEVRNASGHGHEIRIELDSAQQVEMFIKTQRRGMPVSGSPFTATVKPFLPAGQQTMIVRSSRTTASRTSPVNFQAGGPVQQYLPRTWVPRRPSLGGRRDDQANAIDAGRIKKGQDVRTTVMLRNIPNQMTTYDLEALLREWAFGKFDFLYLRIDFANMANVGYAFVNFDSPMTIVQVKERMDKEGWPLSSNKKAAMSYATVQGVESLIEKFRNSSVMCESPQCRPRLFYSVLDDEVSSNPLRWSELGKEKAFPPANNDAKLARSRQNAETQGLFPAHSRDDHRRGPYTSHFDRGNPNGYFGRVGYY